MRNPYMVLGVPRSATGEEIKAAFRRKAKASHPDRNHDNPDAAARFNAINSAYEIIGNSEKRRLFDNGHIDAQGRPLTRKSVFSGFTGMNSWAGFNFKRAKPQGFEETGSTTTEEKPETREQESHEEIMERIFGESFVRSKAEDAPGLDEHPEPDKADLDLHAEIEVSLEEVLSASCQDAELPDGRIVKVNVPAAVEDGRVLRLHGKGVQASDGQCGDAVITIRYKAHKYLRTDGADLITDLAVPLKGGILGAKLPVDGLDGRFLVKVPSWSGSDRVLRVRGKGLPNGGKGRGDLYVHVRLMLPDAKDDDLTAFAKSSL
ncbi:DnaJ C-terminal domain-containing protein [Hoeflea prorocentri]|uniref:DnaJ domain-containing protein n=1 Tax=Hoeflea prorocentri TaxID=1922333 RepID=A0A9X3UJD6_9HYPH|nr:DnaJ C-terminal domain-containing protein [Hoeflea prorocentri]MCY6381671.1 DnaJ domain-containing protein [Hoeflea prorocentri]MDA5399471.1 DnaJ domain-containing protein [Hoeflea prorocentri]